MDFNGVIIVAQISKVKAIVTDIKTNIHQCHFLKKWHISINYMVVIIRFSKRNKTSRDVVLKWLSKKFTV